MYYYYIIILCNFVKKKKRFFLCVILGKSNTNSGAYPLFLNLSELFLLVLIVKRSSHLTYIFTSLGKRSTHICHLAIAYEALKKDSCNFETSPFIVIQFDFQMLIVSICKPAKHVRHKTTHDSSDKGFN